MSFKLNAPFSPTGDQPQAIAGLTRSIEQGNPHQTLLGVTGSGKTYTMANVIANTGLPTLIVAHNKTLAAQLYQEFRDFFPNNAVSYFVSYYDYYQPEAYIPNTDTYIEKEATINDEIDKLRLASTTNLLTRPDVIVVSSVSCIYNLGSPVEYGRYILQLVEGEIIARQTLLLQLSSLQYDRSETDLMRGTYRVRGESIQVWPAYEDKALRIDTLVDRITSISWIDPISGEPVLHNNSTPHQKRFLLYPAKHYIMDPKSQLESMAEIKKDLQERVTELKNQGKNIEAYRLEQKVNYDLDMMQEFGFVNGIENYSRYFDGRKEGEPPFSLLDYFTENARLFGKKNFLTIIDESHITLPQIRGMYFGDKARKQTLIDYGFRLPSAKDNRPLQYNEFLERTPQVMHVSATPQKEELSLSENTIFEQVIRPTGLLDPTIELRPIDGQIEDLVCEIVKRKQQKQRVLVTTLTKKMAETLTEYLNEPEKIDLLLDKRAQRDAEPPEDRIVWSGDQLPIDDIEIGRVDPKYHRHLSWRERMNISRDNFEYPKVAYLHSDVETLDRMDILDDLRRGVYDVVVGINLLREGLDLPEVSLVAILDADKAGFLRSETSLIQTMGRAARHQEGHAILYADIMTAAMHKAIGETQRRRNKQHQYNLDHGITPLGISKAIREKMVERETADQEEQRKIDKRKIPTVVDISKNNEIDLATLTPETLTPVDISNLSRQLKKRMNQAAKDMDFELAALIRDTITRINS